MIRVAPAGPADVLALTELLEEMDRFYGAAGGRSRDERVRQTSEALFSDPAAAQVLLAWEEPDRMQRGLRGSRYSAVALAAVRRRGWAHSVGEREAGRRKVAQVLVRS